MVFKKFAFGVLVRLLLLSVCIVGSVVVWLNTDWVFTQLIFTALVLLLLFELFRFTTKTNKDLAKFIDALNYQDYQVSFSSYKLGNAFEELHASFRKTLDLFRELKLEKEAHYHYLNLLVKQVKVGIVSIKSADEISLYNEAAEQLLASPNLKSWQRYQSAVPVFFEKVGQLDSHGKALVKLSKSGRELALTKHTLILQGEKYTILVFQDIRAEVEDRELAAWNQLIRILTHEIMNSVTPIISLTDTLLDLQEHPSPGDMQLALQTIQKRSHGLLHFVEDYRKLVSLPNPIKKPVDIESFANQIFELHQAQITKLGIQWKLKLDLKLKFVSIDEVLIEQALINLISNAIYAVEAQPNKEIDLLVSTRPEYLQIVVNDNGKGIEPNQLGEIFVPFYSTRKGGSGIGLSLAKQIINQHKGQLKVESQLGLGSQFSMQLPID